MSATVPAPADTALESVLGARLEIDLDIQTEAATEAGVKTTAETTAAGSGGSSSRGLRLRQMRLFPPLENPLTQRFGNAFFRALPRLPGVYFFHDSQDRLLYIGQSCDLRARLGSYRHVTEGRHARRTLRLVVRVARIEWRVCPTAAEAVAEEGRLLLEHRPPFNRAGVWKGEPWWLLLLHEEEKAEAPHADRLLLRLLREPVAGSLGPLPAGFRRTLPVFLRGLLRVEHPEWRLADFPCGLMHAMLPLELCVRSACVAHLRQELSHACTQGPARLHAALAALPPPASAAEQELWQEETERLETLAARWPGVTGVSVQKCDALAAGPCSPDVTG